MISLDVIDDSGTLTLIIYMPLPKNPRSKFLSVGIPEILSLYNFCPVRLYTVIPVNPFPLIVLTDTIPFDGFGKILISAEYFILLMPVASVIMIVVCAYRSYPSQQNNPAQYSPGSSSTSSG